MLKIGDGELGIINDGEGVVQTLEKNLINKSDHAFDDLVEFIYPSLLENMSNVKYSQDRAILASLKWLQISISKCYHRLREKK